jgi:hypothetical protein
MSPQDMFKFYADGYELTKKSVDYKTREIERAMRPSSITGGPGS